VVDRDGRVLGSAGPGAGAAVSGAGAGIVESPVGGRGLAVKVHWWFDAYHACRYRVRYTRQRHHGLSDGLRRPSP
jgi:hypothetical protein